MRFPIGLLSHRSPYIRAAHAISAVPHHAMSTFTSDLKADDEPVTTSSSDSDKPPLALPEAPQSPGRQLDVSNGGTAIKLDHLGPMVVNVDGSMSRISNWTAMAEIEKKNTLRIIAKRNQERLAALRAKEDGN